MTGAEADTAGEPLRPLTLGELLAQLDSAGGSQSGGRALLLVELSDLLHLREALGFEAAEALTGQFALDVSRLFAARARVCRFGDAALCVVLHRVLNRGHAVLAAERIRRSVTETMAPTSVLARHLSIGVALEADGNNEPSLLLRDAQLAAATARRRSEAIVVFEESFRETALTHGQLGFSLRPAFEEGKLQMHYQPKVRIRDGAVVGVEALMRWIDGDNVIAAPDIFLPLAEERGINHELAWMSLTQGLRLSQALGGLPVAVNITPEILHEKEFVEMVETATRAWDARAGVLTLELTEGALVADFAEAQGRLSHLRKQGIRVSIDDFGTGYSSLSYFKSIPADELKIDKSFILGMAEDAADQKLVKAIIGLAHQFDLKVVAEGVETSVCAEMLAALRCDYAQGFLYARAMGEDLLRTWLWENRLGQDEVPAPPDAPCRDS